MSCFTALPMQFKQPGKVNIATIVRYYRDDTATKFAGRFRILIHFSSNQTIIAEFDTAQERDNVYQSFDRLLTGRDKFPQYDILPDEE